LFSLPQTSSRQREILEIVLGNGWDYMRRLLTGGKPDEPQLPPPEVLRKILIELGPFYIKLGQLLSTRPDLLPPNYIQALTALQAQVPTIPWDEVETVMQQQLNRPVEEVFQNIDRSAVAAGSIAQIHKAILLDGREVALKIQRPNLDKLVERDSLLINAIAEIVALTEFGKNYDTIALAKEFTNAVKAELDFTQEAKFTEQLKNNLANSNWFDSQQLVVPSINWEITTEKLLVMEWLSGNPILEADLLQQKPDKLQRKQEITTLLFRAFFQQIYLDGFFHADPHPGNIFYLTDDRIAIIDCGMVGRLDPRTQQILTEMLLAIVDLDAQRCSELTMELSDSVPNTNIARLRSDFDRVLRRYYSLNLSELNFSAVFYEILQIARNNKIKLPANLGLFAKSLANLEGLARNFNPEINVFDEVKPLIADLFRRQVVGTTPLESLLRTVLDLKYIALKSPRQLEVLLERFSSETLQWNISLKELDSLRRSLDDSANRLSFSILVGSLIMGAAIISSSSGARELSLISDILFAVASLIGLWLIISILRSGRLQ
jgi:ubiquinone biosynthesis protein